MSRLILGLLGLLCSSGALLVLLWIVVPAPGARFAVVAVGAGEWSLWFGLLGLLGASLSAAALSIGTRQPGLLGLVLGLLAWALALLPPLQAGAVARANDVSISLARYLLGAAVAADTAQPETVTYATLDGQPLQLDIYRSPNAHPPGQSAAARPAIIVLHGGAWRAGNRSELPRWNRWLAEQGFVVFDAEYRLAPQPNWLTATGDVKCAIGWVRRNAAQYGIDPARIALLGRSAGGHLALLAGYTSEVVALPPSCDAGDTGVRAVIALYAPTDLVWGYDHPTNQRVIDGPATLRALLGGDPQAQRAAYTLGSPVTHVGPHTPPTLLFHGGRDQYVSARNMQFLAERLRQSGVPFRAIELPYAQHGFDFIFNGWGGQIVRPVLQRFLEQHLVRDERVQYSR